MKWGLSAMCKPYCVMGVMVLCNEEPVEQPGSSATTAQLLLSGALRALLPQKPEPEEAAELPSSGVGAQGVPGFAEQKLDEAPGGAEEAVAAAVQATTVSGRGVAGPLAAAPRTRRWADMGTSTHQEGPEPDPREVPAAPFVPRADAEPWTPWPGPAAQMAATAAPAAPIDTEKNCRELRKLLLRDLEVLETSQTSHRLPQAY